MKNSKLSLFTMVTTILFATSFLAMLFFIHCNMMNVYYDILRINSLICISSLIMIFKDK